MKKFHFIFTALFLMGILNGCYEEKEDLPIIEPEKPEEPEKPTRTTTDEQYYANQFAQILLEEAYLWNEEIAADIPKLDENTNTDPISTVKEIRYKQNGKEIDRWSLLTNDYASFTGSVEGVSTTYGYNLLLSGFSNMEGVYYYIVAYVYANSPAEKAGLKRGDIIMQLDGKNITAANYLDAYYSSTVTLGMATLSENGIGLNGKSINLTAITMYEDPVLLHKTFDIDGKKVGYLAYASFDLASIPKLIEISKEFKAAGVKELILDLRYNGGGYVITEELMASLFAPEDVVKAKKVFHTNIYNKFFTEYYKQNGEPTSTKFKTEHSYKDDNGKLVKYDTSDANIGLEKIYALISSSSASASEGLLIGLMPYMKEKGNAIELIGQPSHGKYCTGGVYRTSDVFTTVPAVVKNWGFYVMIGRFGDCNGDNPSMPDGLQPTIPVKDYPLDGLQLGDENELMLKAALQRAGKVYPVGTRSLSTLPQFETRFIPSKLTFGMRIDTRAADMLKKRLEE